MRARPEVTPAVATPAGPVRTSWTAVGVTVLAGLAVAFQVGKLVTALPTVSADLGFGLTVGGAVLGAFTAVSAVSGAALGTLVGRTLRSPWWAACCRPPSWRPSRPSCRTASWP